MLGKPEDSVDLWRRLTSAVEYLEAVDKPGFTVWDAIADAIALWTDDTAIGSADVREWSGDVDRLRYVIGVLVSRLPPRGAPGGVAVEAALEAAMSNWLERVAADLNDGCPFSNTARIHTNGHR